MSPFYCEKRFEVLGVQGSALQNTRRRYASCVISYEPSLVEKESSMVEEKGHRQVRSFSYRGRDTVVIDAGTTTIHIVRSLMVNKAKIVTNFLKAALEVPYKPDIEVLLTGGNLRFSTQALVGPVAENFLQHIRVDKAFIGTNGVTLEGFSTPNVLEAALKEPWSNVQKKSLWCRTALSLERNPLSVLRTSTKWTA